LHGHLVSDGLIELNDLQVESDFHGMKELAKIGVVLGEFFSPLRKDKGDGFNIPMMEKAILWSDEVLILVEDFVT
jgi:hypothetical protein